MTHDQHARRGRLLLIVAAVFWSMSGLFLKSDPLAALPLADRGPALACYRALFAALGILPFVRWSRARWVWLLLPTIIAFTLMNALVVTAFTRTTAAAAIFLQYTATVWAFLFGVLFLRERVDRPNLIALIFAVCGITWIVWSDWHGANFTGNLLALGSGLSFGAVILFLRALRNEESLWIIFLLHLVSGAVLLPWVLHRGVSLSTLQWTLIALMGMVQMGLPYVLFARGVRHVRVQEASLLLLLEPILNPIWVLIVWGEEVPLATWIGGGLIVGGLALRYLILDRKSVV